MHAKEAHQDSTDIMGSRDNAEAKQQFLKKAYVITLSNLTPRDQHALVEIGSLTERQSQAAPGYLQQGWKRSFAKGSLH